jgi:ABC-2 type transport system ATP-binding protein
MSWGLDDVEVRYGSKVALSRVSLQVPDGAVTAVVGGDGAGKTTALRVLAGAIAPTSGRVHRPDPTAIGYVSSGPGVYRDLSVDENLAFSARAYGMEAAVASRRSADLLEAADLGGARDRLVGALSGGMRQKFALVAALLHGPRLLVLDEPTTGVDPVSRAELWRLIGWAAAGGAAVVFATTYLDEAERAARVLVLEDGRPVASGAPDDVVRDAPGAVVASDARPATLRAWRRGRRWHAWSPDGAIPPGSTAVRPDLQDAVIASSLARRAGVEVSP